MMAIRAGRERSWTAAEVRARNAPTRYERVESVAWSAVYAGLSLVLVGTGIALSAAAVSLTSGTAAVIAAVVGSIASLAAGPVLAREAVRAAHSSRRSRSRERLRRAVGPDDDERGGGGGDFDPVGR